MPCVGPAGPEAWILGHKKLLFHFFLESQGWATAHPVDLPLSGSIGDALKAKVEPPLLLYLCRSSLEQCPHLHVRSMAPAAPAIPPSNAAIVTIDHQVHRHHVQLARIDRTCIKPATPVHLVDLRHGHRAPPARSHQSRREDSAGQCQSCQGASTASAALFSTSSLIRGWWNFFGAARSYTKPGATQRFKIRSL
jgi:hypothetical protein